MLCVLGLLSKPVTMGVPQEVGMTSQIHPGAIDLSYSVIQGFLKEGSGASLARVGHRPGSQLRDC